MLYRQFGTSGVKVSAISFGAMRWPSEQACHEIIQRGLDRGLNYVDTSTGYCFGKSQEWTGRAVRGRREQILFSSKSAFGKAPSADEVRANIDKSLRATGLEYFDIYQLWGLGSLEVLSEALAKGGTLAGIHRAIDEGLVRTGIGFTFHGPAEVFRAAIDTGEFLCATVSYNLMNRKEEGNIAYAASKGVGIVAMNPLAGGVLALGGDATIDFLREGDHGPAWGALRFLHATPGVTTPIVGFRDVAEVEEAVASLEGAQALDEDFRQDLMRRMDAVRLIEGDFCTGCGYCKVCPKAFDPSKLMQAMRDFARYGVPRQRLGEWLHSKYPHQDIYAELAKCDQCGACEEKCPQDLPIRKEIRAAREVIGPKSD